MIKLFIKIRKKLLNENKISKYLLNAIGEIVLIVIGILIALQINNWNDKNNSKKTLSKIYSIIKSDLELDIKNINKVFTEMSGKDSIHKMIIDQSITFDYFYNCNSCFNILKSYPDFTLQQLGLSQLQNYSSSIEHPNDSLIIEINQFYHKYNLEINVDIESIKIDTRDNWLYWKNNMSWYTDYSRGIKSKEFANHVVTSFDFRNRVTEFHLLYYEIFLLHLKEYKKNSIKLIKTINARSK